MEWRTTANLAEFLAAAGGYLRRQRARNTVILTVTEQLRQDPDPYSAADAGPAARPLFGCWTGPGGGAFMHTPPFPLVLAADGADGADGADAADVAADLAATLAGRPLSGVTGSPEAAQAFAAVWRAATGGQVAVHLRQRLYRLGQLAWPAPAADGAPRVAGAADSGLVVGWFAAFSREIDALGPDDRGATARDRLSHGGVLLWEAGGVPVSMACVTREVAGMIRVGPVYTPPELRGRGYASAVTAAVSQRALEAGAEEVLLFTDLANPVSNSIYQRLGYSGVEDRTVLAFFAAG